MNILPAATRFDWTNEAIDRLETLWRDGDSATRIATILGGCLTRNAVIGKVHRLGLAKCRTCHKRHGRCPAGSQERTEAEAVIRNELAEAERQRKADAERQRKADAERQRKADAKKEPNKKARANKMVASRQAAQSQIAELERAFTADAPTVTFLELKELMCRWPIGEPGDLDEFRYCGAPKHPGGGAYCHPHATLAYQPSAERRRTRAARR